MDTVNAPFTDEQVASLNAYQYCVDFHPFTCPVTHNNGQGILVAINSGWSCPDDDYVQLWAHAFMADWTWKIFKGGWATNFGRKEKNN